MRVLRNLLWFFASAVLAAACTHASAQTAGFSEFGSWAYEWANGRATATLTGPNGQTTQYPMGPSAVGQTVANGSGGVTLSRSGPVNLSGAAGSQGATATLTATRTATARQIATGALSRARGGPVGVVGGLLVTAGLEWALDQWHRRDLAPGAPIPHTQWGSYYTTGNACARLKPGQVGVNITGGAQHQLYQVGYYNPGQPPAGWQGIANWCSNYPDVGGKGAGVVYKVVNSAYDPQTVTVPSTDEQIESAIETSLTSSPSSAPSVVDEVIQNGGEIEASAPAISGPASVSSPSRTTTTSNGSQTSQTTYNITYNNNSYSYSSSTTTTTRDAQGNTTDTTTRDTTPEPGDVDVTPAVRDAAMPPVPTLYERKYPDGIVGVWETRKSELQETGFAAALDALLPDIPDGGGCPQFSLPGGDIAGFAFPGGNLGPPCWVWPWVKVVIVITSLFLARSLVFGG